LEKTLETIRFFFLKVFDIRNGELQRALLMQFIIFLIISTLLILKPTVNGLFLAKFGVEQLPFAFILVALVAAIFSTLYSRILTKVSLYKISFSTLILSVGSLIFFGVFLRFNFLEDIILYVFYIWVAIFALVTTSQFWILANIIFNPREAKRLFGFVGAGAIAGGIFGGYLTSILAETMGSENLPFICAGLLSICIPLNNFVWKKNTFDSNQNVDRLKKVEKSRSRPFKLIRESKHLTYIALIIGLSVMVAKLVDYLFGGIASKLIPDVDELTAFFGFWFSTFNVISLLLQLFLTRRVVGTYGVGVSLFFLPGIILFAVVLLIFFPTLLMAAVFLKMADGSLKQSINKASIELLIMPVSKEVKNVTKTFIDVFVDSLATGIIGLLLIFVIKGLDLPMITVSWMILGLLFLWIYFANKVRKEYLRAFRLKLQALNPKSKIAKDFDLSNTSVLEGWRKVLENGSDSQVLFVLQKLRESPDDRLFESIKRLLDHPSDKIKAEALRNLYFFKRFNLSKEVKRFTNHSMQEVKIAAFEYLLLRDKGDEIALMKQYVSDPDYRVAGAALVSLAKETLNNSSIQQQLDFELLLNNKIKSLTDLKDESEYQFCKIVLLKTISYANLSSYYHIIKDYLFDKDATVVKEAIVAAGKTKSTYFINDLLTFLDDKETRSIAEQALSMLGPDLIPILRHKIQSPEFTLESLRRISAVVKKVSGQSSVNFLMNLLDYEDGMVRLEALRGLNTLRNLYPHLDFYPKGIAQRILAEAELYQNTLTVLYAQGKVEQVKSEKDAEVIDARESLVGLLKKKLDNNLERIFRLLGLKYPPEDIFKIFQGLNSEQFDLSVNAIEFLDNLLEPNIKKVLVPLVETSMLETISDEVVQNLRLKIPSEMDCLQMLLEGKDVRLKIATLYLIGKLRDKKYLSLVKKLLDHPNDNVKYHAKDTMDILESLDEK
jgi:AAA family ATP:ADP antiporter